MHSASKLCLLALTFLVVGCTPRETAPTTNVSRAPLTLWMTGTPEEVRFFEGIGREYAASGGGTIDVVNFSHHTTLQSSLLDSMAEGIGPDVVFTHADWIAWNQQKVIPLGQNAPLTSDKFRTDYVRAASDLLVSGGRVYGVPMWVETLALIYNQDHIITRLPDSNVPATTWPELVQDVPLLTRADQSLSRFNTSAIALGTQNNVSHPVWALMQLMTQLGTEWLTPDSSAALFAQATGISSTGQGVSPGAAGLEFLQQFADPTYNAYNWNDLQPQDADALLNEELTIMLGTSQDWQNIQSQLNSRSSRTLVDPRVLQVAPIPSMPPESESRLLAQVGALFVPRTAQNPESAWSFLLYMGGQDRLAAYTENTGRPTPRVDLISQAKDPAARVWALQAKRAFAVPFPLGFTWWSTQLEPGFADADPTWLREVERSITQILQEKASLQSWKDSLQPPTP